ncbi:peptide/nickel transport system permease protein [Aureimonas altamirensis DSM 21988]|uniref:Binding-protein-dependent transporter inner membrane component n=2 Tax=Aureimonas altamirensis TaxID=370622 RepID=A0A0P0YXQ3_9HYPH|nr:ABC transporter permease [Aureimonas altamirensis]BAT26195.1 binding-protein-dependent transporter inner membrane component [Aureimonas altamirensis]SHJ40449.1 peptide/nickel transport system permease protein [Aureimonas altamirensis DSM 21988]
MSLAMKTSGATGASGRGLSLRKVGRAIAPVLAGLILATVILAALLAPWIAPHDPIAMSPMDRLKPPSADFILGTDAYGRDLFSRILYGARTSLVVGAGVAVAALLIGLPLGILAGFFRPVDAVLMRLMDGLMAIPGILLAIAIVALGGSSIQTVLIAITIPEIPRVVRLVRSVVLTTREEPYVEAAIALGTSLPRIMWRHLMPSTFAPLIIQGTYIAASAILTEAILSFLGAGIGTETPSWGNVMAEGRLYFQLKPSLILWPGLVLSLCILSINILGDKVRDLLDPRQKLRGA